MKTPLHWLLLLPFGFLVFFACVKDTKVTQPYVTGKDCKNLTFKRDCTKVSIDTLDNTFFFDDSGVAPKASRLDLRIVDKTGNIYLFTFRDETDTIQLSSGNYFGFGAQTFEPYFYKANYVKSTYQIDSQLATISNFNLGTMTCSGTFSARMIDTAKKDTIRINKGIFTNICFTPRK